MITPENSLSTSEDSQPPVGNGSQEHNNDQEMLPEMPPATGAGATNFKRPPSPTPSPDESPSKRPKGDEVVTVLDSDSDTALETPVS